ncbi:MarR family winged helix-turn-helix transcriptional regulator [Lacticaseibacillus saniviri]|uniref:Transcriptional regulator n=1 Tax=Lacticaseibacillus saniviri JCM 17471 = DSM 24301 TaxID=1293598 RepID=A0A0R2MWL5_9LACO|nr:MarR family winged helix-turn-helix transcriptional regulator [Lacticaseibacillus saniviri]KRO17833.1 Transcriptional regulator [Lacticaseibacillus saniviri JCM 17471 = DSM 24301]MCG4282086.1 MarR family winged helix-turn-helix transcriptional regulator [Lacticaseibacillus saniviri]
MTNEQLLMAFIDTYFTTLKNINDLISKPMSEYQLSFEQYQILYDVANADKITLMDIVNRRGVTKPAIARQIKILRSYGFLRQEIDESDRRRHFLYLTPTGKEVEKKLTKSAAQQFSSWVHVLGNDKAEQLLALLNEVGDKIIKPTPSNVK